MFEKFSSKKLILVGKTSTFFTITNAKINSSCSKNLFFGDDKIFKSEKIPRIKINTQIAENNK